jgi:hypothetical protein
MTGNAILRDQSEHDQVLSLNKQMEELAAAGEWSEVEELMHRRNTMIKVIEGSDREAALLAARQTTLQVQRMAEAARKEVAEKLSQLQRGRKATDSYLAHA